MEKIVRVVSSADSELFEKRVQEALGECHDMTTEVHYQPLICTDEGEYVLYTAMIIGR